MNKYNRLKTLVVLILIHLSMTAPVLAVSSIQVMALFNGKAVIRIDNSQRMLAVGQTSPEGVKLISADSEKAILQVNGARKTYRLGSAVSIGTQFRQQSETVVQAFPDSMGMYFIQGSINSYSIRFLIDTGATNVAMNSTQADRLGIDYKLVGKQAFASTASGIAKAYTLTLKKVKIGEIELLNVKAMVLEGGFPREVLLGMSFLSRVSVARDGRRMQIKKRH